MSPALPPLWPAIADATQANRPRLPWWIADPAQPQLPPQRAGSVAVDQLDALMRWPQALTVDTAWGVTLRLSMDERTAFLAEANAVLRREGLVVGWRDEVYPVHALAEDDSPGPLLAKLERAAARFWGTLTYGAHCNGYVADDSGRPQALWIARRSLTKPTDPGLLDNLIGGGVPHGQTPFEALQREAWEEAGLQAADLKGLRAGRCIAVARDLPEGFQRERVSVWDLALPAGLKPVNQDGEVHSLTLMPLDEAFARCAAGELTVDATLVTLDFALRHGLLPPDQARSLATASQALWRDAGPAMELPRH